MGSSYRRGEIVDGESWSGNEREIGKGGLAGPLVELLDEIPGDKSDQ